MAVNGKELAFCSVPRFCWARSGSKIFASAGYNPRDEGGEGGGANRPVDAMRCDRVGYGTVRYVEMCPRPATTERIEIDCKDDQ
jgi:hypothetical protein